MFKKAVIVIFLFLVLLISSNTWAHHPTISAGTGQTGPIKTISASTLPSGKWAIALQTESIWLDAFSNSELSGFASDGQDVHSTDTIFHMIFGVAYGVTDNLTLSLKIPYVYLNNIREVHHDEPEEIHNRGDSKGIGDLTILGQYRFLKKADIDFESSFLFGLKIPTGKTNVKDSNGERFETEFQPGTGSWDPLVGFAVTKRFRELSVDANVLYTFATKGAQDTNLGDILHYNLALSYRALGSKKFLWDLIIEANGERKQKEKVSGVKDENSGGNTIFLSPGMRFTFNQQWSAFLSVGFPIIQNLNGVQNDTHMKALFGISVGF